MAVKHISLRIHGEMLEKLSFIARHEGRSINSHILVLIRNSVRAFEAEHGSIDGDICPAINANPSRPAPD